MTREQFETDVLNVPFYKITVAKPMIPAHSAWSSHVL
jgi:hypothetical protein